MFYIIGLGLADAKDITVNGLEIIKKCHRVYLESYTSILTVQQGTLVCILYIYVNDKLHIDYELFNFYVTFLCNI